MAQGKSQTQRLNGLPSLAYLGVQPSSPQNFFIKQSNPTTNDYRNCYVGDFWLNNASMYATPPTAPTISNLYILVSVANKSATWLPFSAGMLETLTGNTGGAVGPTGNNINVVGDGTTITIAGNPGTSTLTASVIGTGVVSALGTDDGHTVTPTAGVILIAGGSNLATTGTVGPNTVTIHLSGITQHSVQIGGASNALTQLANGTTGQVLTAQTGSDPIWSNPAAVANSFPTDSGTATPSAGVLNIKAANATLNAGSSVEFTGSSNNVTLNVTDSSSNTIIGNNAGNLTLTATNSVGLGKTVLHALTSGVSNTVVGSLSGAAITTGANNTIIGEGAGASFTTGSGNIIVGQAAGSSLATSDGGNILINHAGVSGHSNLFAMNILSAGINSWIMHNYPGTPTSGNGTNFFIGQGAGNFTLTGANADNNYGFGESTLNALTTGPHNIAIGSSSLGLLTSGNGNVGVGHGTYFNAGAGTGLLTGNQNIALGYTAGSAWTGAESNNIAMATQGVAGESQVTRIGGFNGGETLQTKCFIQGIRAITTVNNNAIAVLIDSAGQLGTVSSSRTKKDNIVDMGSYSDVIRSLRPVVFNYKEHSPESKSIGLIAEEVSEVAPQLVVYKDGEPETVKYHDLVPMLLNEFQKHCQLIGTLQVINADLLNRIRMLEEENLKRRS